MIIKKMSIPVNYLNSFPFLEKAKEYIEQQSLDPVDSLLSDPLLMEKLREIFIEAMQKRQESRIIGNSQENSLLIWGLLRMILMLLESPAFSSLVSRLIQKTFFRRLLEQDFSTLIFVSKLMGIPVDSCEPEHSINATFTLHFIKYLELSHKMKDKAYKLVNQHVNNGMVWITKRMLARLLSEVIRQDFIKIRNKKVNPDLKEALFDSGAFLVWFNQIRNMVENHESQQVPSVSLEKVHETCFPPCIINIIDRMQKGMNLFHVERLFFVNFCLNINMKVEIIMKYFKSQPDFKPEYTEKQILHAKKRGYAPHNCDYLESLHVCCKANNEFCSNPPYNFVNPKIFYLYQLREKEKTKNER